MKSETTMVTNGLTFIMSDMIATLQIPDTPSGPKNKNNWILATRSTVLQCTTARLVQPCQTILCCAKKYYILNQAFTSLLQAGYGTKNICYNSLFACFFSWPHLVSGWGHCVSISTCFRMNTLSGFNEWKSMRLRKHGQTDYNNILKNPGLCEREGEGEADRWRWVIGSC